MVTLLGLMISPSPVILSTPHPVQGKYIRTFKLTRYSKEEFRLANYKESCYISYDGITHFVMV